jgi:hypothetical protein
VAFGVFLMWGAAMASLAGATLICKGTILDRIWALNPRAYRQLTPLGAQAGIPLLIIACALAAAGVGWFKRRRWAYWLALAIISTQILGDLMNLFMGRLLEGVIGVAAAGALLFYLLRARVPSSFQI